MEKDLKDYIQRIKELEIANWNAQAIIDAQQKQISILKELVDKGMELANQQNEALERFQNKIKTLEKICERND